ncbi:MAG: GntR family transcriptional regulator [Acidimicrobiales bacterium]
MAQLLDRLPTAPAAPPAAAYRVLAEQLRRDMRGQRYRDGQRLPTEAELSNALGLSRQTVRRAFQELVAEGAVYRVPGRGTFARDDAGKYLRPTGSIEDLMTIGVDTELEVVEPPAVRVELEAAGRLRLDTDEVVTITFRRFHEGQPFCVTTAYLPVPLGKGLFHVAELTGARVRRRMTVLSVVQTLAGTPIAGADQSITAVTAPARLCAEIDVEPGEPVLRIDRVYFDAEDRLLELAVNYFNPARYSYRFRMGETPQ